MHNMCTQVVTNNGYTAAALTQQMLLRALSGVPLTTTALGLRLPLMHTWLS
jgi:hypothetical protein